MTQFFKSVRVLLCALALSASVHAAAQAQAAAATPTPTPYRGAGRLLSLVTEKGTFKSEFKSFSEALKASQGNSYNQTLKQGSEIIVMNARCADGIFGDKVTFSIYELSNYTLSNNIAPLVKAFLDYRKANPTMTDSKQRDRALINEIIRLVSIASPRKADCDAVAVALSLSTFAPNPLYILFSTEVMRLEVDDAQSPLVGPKINDGFLYDELLRNMALMRTKQAQERGFWEKFGYNRSATLQDAMSVSSALAWTKVIIHNGTNFSLYRVNDLNYDYGASEAKLVEAFKTSPIRKGWKIVALVRGSKFIQIYNPNVKK